MAVSCIDDNLVNLVLQPLRRREIVAELLRCVYELDARLVERCKAYLEENPTSPSALLQMAFSYVNDLPKRRPLHVAAHYIQSVLAKPIFLQEFYLVLLVISQFEGLHQHIAKHTPPDLYLRYFQHVDYPLYERLKTFVTGNEGRLQSVHQFMESEFVLFCSAYSRVRGT